jgi:NADH:ubiquinone oxidoreductase subunit 6 (subunit J)
MPLLLTALLLGAHFLRNGNLILTLFCLLAPLLLLIKKQWSWLMLQVLIYLGAFIWLNTTIAIIQQRILWGQPWDRVLLIMGTVILFTIWAGLLLNSQKIKPRYHNELFNSPE